VRFAINLRSDLTTLNDAELSSELQRFKEYRKARFESEPRFGSVKGIVGYADGWPFGRGPVYARWAYKIWIGYFWPYRGRRGTLYLVECEIKDINDEIQRRPRARTTAPQGIR
jgi:hypothetical protein